MKYQVPQNIKIIIGLGNPDKEYANTYHNVGFLAIDYLVKNQNLKIKNQNDNVKFKNVKYFNYLKIDEIILIKSETFMNESGKMILEVKKYFKAKLDGILIIHDDSDIEIGKYKISFDRGSAGHNGVESIIKSLKTKDFWRLRIGIRPPIRINQHKISINLRLKAAAFVLKKINKKNLEILDNVFEEAMKKI
ncbi:MAG: aminoacyl-tRNA hydrolase [Patescibacteria group bacterium]